MCDTCRAYDYMKTAMGAAINDTAPDISVIASADDAASILAAASTYMANYHDMKTRVMKEYVDFITHVIAVDNADPMCPSASFDPLIDAAQDIANVQAATGKILLTIIQASAGRASAVGLDPMVVAEKVARDARMGCQDCDLSGSDRAAMKRAADALTVANIAHASGLDA